MNDMTWIAKCNQWVAKGALDVLEDICEKFDLAKTSIAISPYVYGMGIGQEDNVRRARMEIAEMLVARGVLKSAEYFHVRGPFLDPDQKEGIRIVADEATVREARRLLHERIHYPPGSVIPGSRSVSRPVDPSAPSITLNPTINVSPTMTVASPAAPVPLAASHDPIEYEVKKTHQVERVKIWYVIAAGVATALIVTALLGGGKWVSQRWKDATPKPKSPAAAPMRKNPVPAGSTNTGVDRGAWHGTG